MQYPDSSGAHVVHVVLGEPQALHFELKPSSPHTSQIIGRGRLYWSNTASIWSTVICRFINPAPHMAII